ncbi:ankyrin [Penicillium sp. IBT 35674x]|nr:ankyrin [Penicillium sp. IBT 35674x]
MPVPPRDAASMPIELILVIAKFLQPDDMMNLLQAVKGLCQYLTYHHLAVKGENGSTLLHLIAKNGDENLMKILLAKSVISAVRHDEITPLQQAAAVEQISRTRFFARTSISVNELDRDKSTPLHWAAKLGHDPIVKMLLDRDDIEPDLENLRYRTPLSFAAEHGHLPVVDLLLRQNNVTPDSKDYYDRTPLSFAAEKGHVSIVELLLQQKNIDADAVSYDQDASGRWLPQDGGRTPLSFAAENGHLAVVKLLVQRHDVDADSTDDSQRTPLWWAAKNGHLAVVELLVQREDVDTNSKDKFDRTPLSWAAAKGHQAVVELLVKRAVAGTDSEDMSGRTTLL